jgi:hypothetical protein
MTRYCECNLNLRDEVGVDARFGVSSTENKLFVDEPEGGARPEFYLWGGGGGPYSEAVNNLFYFKNYVIKSYHKYNITLFANIFIYIQI